MLLWGRAGPVGQLGGLAGPHARPRASTNSVIPWHLASRDTARSFSRSQLLVSPATMAKSALSGRGAAKSPRASVRSRACPARGLPAAGGPRPRLCICALRPNEARRGSRAPGAPCAQPGAWSRVRHQGRAHRGRTSGTAPPPPGRRAPRPRASGRPGSRPPRRPRPRPPPGARAARVWGGNEAGPVSSLHLLPLQTHLQTLRKDGAAAPRTR